MRKNDYQMVYFIAIMLTLFLLNAFILGCAGHNGKDGPVGPAAPTPIVTTTPAPGFACPAGGNVVAIGSTSFVVCNGQSIIGPTGPSGAPGIDATPVTVVDLCPGASTYPGVFVEVGICLDGQLYGVYSANGGFLTYLPPGNYTSNGIGSACNLTVGPNCQVSH